MTALLWLFVAALAAWRLTSLVARERGPFALGVLVRRCFGVHHDVDGTPARDEGGDVLLNPVTALPFLDRVLHEIGLAITCVWCCSVWISALLVLLLRAVAPALVFDLSSFLLITLALSAAVIGLERLLA